MGGGERTRQVEERRVVYAGGIEEGTLKADLRARFQVGTSHQPPGKVSLVLSPLLLSGVQLVSRCSARLRTSVFTSGTAGTTTAS